uniref:Uncharacterized protein n=1 Tax=Eutreptiella gymnastica TaxID=73025 RepID=A0A6U7VKL0_9EUGL|mmetsp:Transcript_130704/g.226117  ORF Transcript_130704/g.226117 Transcript_130704/m.226117 type:complete len:106 (+) Transcript_130704:586-903(+)
MGHSHNFVLSQSEQLLSGAFLGMEQPEDAVSSRSLLSHQNGHAISMRTLLKCLGVEIVSILSPCKLQWVLVTTPCQVTASLKTALAVLRKSLPWLLPTAGYLTVT